MAYKKRVLENYNMLATGTGSFQKDDALIGRAVEMHAIDTVKLAANNAKIKGSIEGFDGGQVKIIVDSEDVPFKKFRCHRNRRGFRDSRRNTRNRIRR